MVEHMLAYVSRSNIRATELNSEISEIVATAKIKNKLWGITGALFFHDGHFMQVLEGNIDKLDLLMSDILADTRHSDVTVLLKDEIKARSFGDWNMDFFNLDYHAYFDIENLVSISEIFKQSLTPHGKSFVDFHRTMLESVARIS
jgi:Sensors of blue-light using FAD